MYLQQDSSNGGSAWNGKQNIFKDRQLSREGTKPWRVRQRNTNYGELGRQFKNDLPNFNLELTGSKIPLF